MKNNKSNLTATDIETKEEQKLSYQEQKELSKKISKLKRDIAKLEEKMEKISEKREELNKDYEEAGRKNDVGKLMEIQEEFERLDNDEMEMMEEWDLKSGKLESLE